ncbi:ABC transporter ATP-binding protein [Actinacidiphila sp. bgisy144]|uniref:ABC transporter ATP-binding protein n=1 Tax=unclassified Actinacidiphila TaxID=2995708 RepID=UPI003EBEB6BF
MLRADSLYVAYGDDRALSGASLNVRDGEMVAVVGSSGSGKSTLLHCLAGIVRPDKGTVDLDGFRIDRADDDQLSALRQTKFGFVFQFGELVAELSLLENVSLPLRFAGVGRRAAERRAAAMLESLGIAALGGRRPGQVSGGQMQRAAVARALVHRPSVVFADEPTGALDSHSSRTVLTALRELSRGQGSAVLLVTHDMRVAESADRVVHVADGQVTAEETSTR